MLQVFGVLCWWINWVIEEVWFILHTVDYNEYSYVRNVIINDAVGFPISVFNFMIIARIIHKSSKIARERTESSDELVRSHMTLIAFMRY